MEGIDRISEVSGFRVLEVRETASTNTLATLLLAEELGDRSVVLTYRQTQGRGLADNRWESEPERNISMTVVFKPLQLPASLQFAVSMVIALGCRDWVNRYVPGCVVKWPNDLYVGERKIAGILIEHQIIGACVYRSFCGIGLNINQREFLSDAPNPVSLAQLTGREVPLQEVLSGLLECIGVRHRQLYDYSGLEQDFLKYLYRRQGIYRWEDEEGEFRAFVSGVDEYGRLVLVDDAGKERVYGFKEVRYLFN